MRYCLRPLRTDPSSCLALAIQVDLVQQVPFVLVFDVLAAAVAAVAVAAAAAAAVVDAVVTGEGTEWSVVAED